MAEIQAGYIHSYALVIGINSYTDPRFVTLGNAEEDAAAFAALISIPPYKFEVTTLLGSKATRKEILEALFKLRKAELNDRIIVYFAGHGYTLSDRLNNETGYLAAADTVPEQDFTALEMDEVTELIRHTQAKHIGFIFDACFSGQALGLTRAPAVAAEKYTERRAYQVLSAGAGDQTVSDFHSMTESLIEAIKSGAANEDGLITFSELGLYLQQNIAADSNQTQIPQFGHLRGSQGGDLVFAISTGTRLPADLEEALGSSLTNTRLGAVADLINMSQTQSDLDLALLAQQRLVELEKTESNEDVRAAIKDFLAKRTTATQETKAIKGMIKPKERTPESAGTKPGAARAAPPTSFEATLQTLWKKYSSPASMIGVGVLMVIVILAAARAVGGNMGSPEPTQPDLTGVTPTSAKIGPSDTDEPIHEQTHQPTETATHAPTEDVNGRDAATATAAMQQAIHDVQNAVRNYDREVRHALETLDTTRLSSVSRGNALNDRLDAISILQQAGNCNWVYDHRSITIDQPTFQSTTQASVSAVIDRDGRVFCGSAEKPEFAFKGPYQAQYTVQFFSDDEKWLVTVYEKRTRE